MKAIYLDCFAGISGNMLLGALLDIGLPEETLREQLAALPIDGYDLVIKKVVKSGIHAVYVDVKLIHADDHDHADDHHHHHRHLADIVHIIDQSQLAEKVKSDSKKIFLLLAQAEAKVHGTTIDEIHFHEVGAVDAIIDIVGTVFGLHYLGIEAIYTSKLHVGSGFVQCCHGLMPIPAPATAELLINIPYYNGNITKELVTPTGAAVIAALGTDHKGMPENFISQKIGYGAGTWDLTIPNVLRMHVGEMTAREDPSETMVVEANIDDLNPQVYPYVMDKLLAIGVLDVWLTPIIMKKNRSAITLSVLINDHLLEKVTQILFEETTTIGLRYYKTERTMAKREVVNVTLPWGQAKAKISSYHGKVCSITPEYEDCKRLAMEHDVPLKKVQQMIVERISQSRKPDILKVT